MTRAIVLAIVPWLATVVPAIPDSFDQYRVKCITSELTAVQDAVAKAKELAQKASATLPPVDSTGGALAVTSGVSVVMVASRGPGSRSAISPK